MQQGCSEPANTVTIKYYRPGAISLAASNGALILGEFTSESDIDRGCGDLMKKWLSVMLPPAAGGKDTQTLNATPVTKPGDFLIHGRVVASDRAAPSPDAPQGQRICRVETTIIIQDAESGHTIYTSEVSREAAYTGPTQQELEGLVIWCVDAFVAGIAAREEVITVVLADVEGTIANRGNAAGASGRHDEALDFYRRALLQNGDDHAILFNAGVMHEIKGNMKRALGLYARALRLQPNTKYETALRRIRRELNK